MDGSYGTAEVGILHSTETVRLYHGSKEGIHGGIAPSSRALCDFGAGFYMGTEKQQPLTLICNYPNAKLYTVGVNLTGLRVFEIAVNLEWALLIAYNRGKMESAKNTSLYQHCASIAQNYDMLIGSIADDRMFTVLDRFFSGEITDIALVYSLSALQLGKQYAAITKKACAQIAIIDEVAVEEPQRIRLKLASERNRAEGIALAEEICRRHRRDGRFFDEILEGGVLP